ncbi:MAG: ATP-binding protein [Syntrophorhabdales bacterium]|jgi:signal transduction histidine kinase
MEKGENIERKLGECEIQLEDATGLASAREELLLTNLKELNDVYAALKEKIREIKERDARIRSFDEVLTRANRLSSLGELAASIAHEIKNPLISIQGFAKRIQDCSDLKKIQDYSGFIEKESQRLSTVLMRLLDYSHMSGPEREYLDLNRMVEDTILFTEHHLTKFKNVDLTVEKGDELPKVYADRIHLQQALVNIMMNAAQAMPEGGPIIIRTGVRGPDYVWVSVTDRGTGIAPENIEKIFDPFFTTKDRSSGTGLGLSLTKKLVEANSGRIEVETVVGGGSTFRIVLPLAGGASSEGT